MTNDKMRYTLTTGLIAAAALVTAFGPSIAKERFVTSTEFSAQQHQDGNVTEKKTAPAQRAQPHAAPQKATPHVAARQRVQQRVATPQRTVSRAATSHVAATRRTSVRTATQAKSNVTQAKVNSRQAKQSKITAKTTNQAAINHRASTSRTGLTSRASATRVVTPRGTKNITASRLRGVPVSGASRTVIRGQNYSAWRSGYRVRHGSSWRTFVALGSLAAIAVGSSDYYPYAYISAPRSYCEGFTADGCQLVWQDVQTIEGDELSQCVAYCPWHSRLGAN